MFPLFTGNMPQDSQWMLKTVDGTEPYIYNIFSYTYIPMIKFNVFSRLTKHLACTMALTFAARDVAAKRGLISFSFTISWIHS